jgi:RNA polymerase sigma factor (sigma-70 family)
VITEEIRRKFINGDHKAFNTVYEKFSAAMFGVCLRYTRCNDDAQEILQEGFIKVFKHCNQYSIEKPLAAWIKTIMINSALTYIKKTYRFELYDEDCFFDKQLDIHLENEEQDLLKKQLLSILNKLPDGYRTVFNLFAIENLTHKEIAFYLGVSENTSKTQYFKAKKMIHSLLKSETIIV